MLDEHKRVMVEAGLADSVDDLDWLTEEHFRKEPKCELDQPRPPGTIVFGTELRAQHGYPSCRGLIYRWWEGEGPHEACESEEEGCACSENVDIVRLPPCPNGRETWEIVFK